MQLQVVNSEDGATTEFNVSKFDILIGTSDTNDVVLYHPSVSGRHLQLSFESGRYEVLDLGSRTGTLVNGKLINGAHTINNGDSITIGIYSITIHPEGLGETGEEQDKIVWELIESKEGCYDESLIPIKREIHQRLIAFLDLRRVNLRNIEGGELRVKTSRAVSSIMDDMGLAIPDHADRESLHKEMLDEVLGLGPIEDLIKEPNITEIMVNGKDQIFVEISGKLYLTQRYFASDDSLLGVIERIVSPLGRRIDESSPMVDARLADGSRVNAIIPPLALRGPTITIRKFSRDPFTAEMLINAGTITKEVIEFFQIVVKHRKNIIISGGTSTGKTTLLNVLSSFLPRSERIVTIEDSAELQLTQEHLVALEARPPNIQGKGEVTIRDLVKNSLRMRPDRIVVGEVRGGEALDMLQAMNTGHDGSLTTGHANSPYDFLRRLETMVLMAGMDLPIRAIREQIASAVNIVVQLMRFSDGVRRVVNVTEIRGLDKQGDFDMHDIFVYKQRGIAEDGRIIGTLEPTGIIPDSFQVLLDSGIAVNMELFNPKAHQFGKAERK